MPSADNAPTVRCAIYTRKSLEYGLEIEFNSLEAQRSICSAYISSQRPNGWVECPKPYEDAAQSGGTLDRPALQCLLSDIECGLIDVVVIYKLDRITRTLLDFVRLIDLFNRFGVTFVSVTQNFDTADSTGRLILNVLLTFAQFEREIAGDRLRDKFGAMRERGMFVGGHPPFGYDIVDKKLVVNREEADVVRYLFSRFAEGVSYGHLEKECAERGFRRRPRITKRGLYLPERRIEAGGIHYMLGSPNYIGMVQHKGRVFEGVHEPIVATELWEKVQKLRNERRVRAEEVRFLKADLLRNLVYDSYGRTMPPFRAYAHGKVRRLYMSRHNEWTVHQGIRRFRTDADQFEEIIVTAMCSFLSNRPRLRSVLLGQGVYDKNLDSLALKGAAAARRLQTASDTHKKTALAALVERIELSPERAKVVIRSPEVRRFLTWDGVGTFCGNEAEWARPHSVEVLDVAAGLVRVKRSMAVPFKARDPASAAVPDRGLLKLIKEARTSLSLVYDNRTATPAEIAGRKRFGPARFGRLIRLNYLAPDIVTAIIDGTQPAGLTRRRLLQTDIPLDWALQRRLLGFADVPDYLQGPCGSGPMQRLSREAEARTVREAVANASPAGCLTL
jgi:site-specific DNA recombinase